MFLILVSALLMCLPAGNVQTLSSPDGNLEMTFSVHPLTVPGNRSGERRQKSATITTNLL